jgi:hypothetical protein
MSRMRSGTLAAGIVLAVLLSSVSTSAGKPRQSPLVKRSPVTPAAACDPATLQAFVPADTTIVAARKLGTDDPYCRTCWRTATPSRVRIPATRTGSRSTTTCPTRRRRWTRRGAARI